MSACIHSIGFGAEDAKLLGYERLDGEIEGGVGSRKALHPISQRLGNFNALRHDRCKSFGKRADVANGSLQAGDRFGSCAAGLQVSNNCMQAIDIALQSCHPIIQLIGVIGNHHGRGGISYLGRLLRDAVCDDEVGDALVGDRSELILNDDVSIVRDERAESCRKEDDGDNEKKLSPYRVGDEGLQSGPLIFHKPHDGRALVIWAPTRRWRCAHFKVSARSPGCRRG